jgi:DNA-binding response OmpR family regulator
MAYVVIVDDDEDFAGAVAKHLHGAGHEVHIQLEAEGAVAEMEKRKPDMVILDVMFPENSSAGFDLARDMRHDSPILRDVPILMLTAINAKFSPLGFGNRDIDDTWLPVTDFLEKPVDLDVLREKVGELLRRGDSTVADSR